MRLPPERIREFMGDLTRAGRSRREVVIKMWVFTLRDELRLPYGGQAEAELHAELERLATERTVL